MQEPEEHAIGYQVVPRGTRVEASGGEQVGTFDRALDHKREHLLDGIVISTGAGRRFVDAPEVARITNRRIILSIPSEEVAALPPYRRRFWR
jgi:hypothetical protein